MKCCILNKANEGKLDEQMIAKKELFKRKLIDSVRLEQSRYGAIPQKSWIKDACLPMFFCCLTCYGVTFEDEKKYSREREKEENELKDIELDDV
jgi:hypothetical protein